MKPYLFIAGFLVHQCHNTRGYLACLLVFYSLACTAQTLPNKQQASIWAPTSVKIDGKGTEWGERFEARNSATGAFYTMSNDRNNLYLVIKITDLSVIKYKVMSGGITLLIQDPDKKTDKNARGISYPIFEAQSRPSFHFYNKQDIPSSPKAAAQYCDSVTAINNGILITTAKTIMTVGIAGVDTLLSLYNENGIKVSGKFDVQQAYIYEIAIPLKFLGIGETSSPTFNYHLIINGGPSRFIAAPSRVTGGRDAGGNPIPQAELDVVNEKLSIANLSRYATTDFWGEYTLAKKP